MTVGIAVKSFLNKGEYIENNVCSERLEQFVFGAGLADLHGDRVAVELSDLPRRESRLEFAIYGRDAGSEGVEQRERKVCVSDESYRSLEHEADVSVAGRVRHL